MIDALYSVFVLVEWGTASYMTAKFVTDYAWEKTVKFLTVNNLWNHPDIQNVLSSFMKGN